MKAGRDDRVAMQLLEMVFEETKINLISRFLKIFSLVSYSDCAG